MLTTYVVCAACLVWFCARGAFGILAVACFLAEIAGLWFLLGKFEKSSGTVAAAMYFLATLAGSTLTGALACFVLGGVVDVGDCNASCIGVVIALLTIALAETKRVKYRLVPLAAVSLVLLIARSHFATALGGWVLGEVMPPVHSALLANMLVELDDRIYPRAPARYYVRFAGERRGSSFAGESVALLDTSFYDGATYV